MNKRVIMRVPFLITVVSHVCLLTCHPAPWRTYSPLFVPGPQFCPDTGRTVCAAVDYYPTERIYNLLTSARSQIFNLTSLFVDERKGDIEPNMSLILTQPPYYQNGDGYGPNQPTPGGRFSPAGRSGAGRSMWNMGNGSPRSPTPSSNGGLSPSSWDQQDRWQHEPPQHGGEQGPAHGNGNGNGANSHFQEPNMHDSTGRRSRVRNQGQRNNYYPPNQQGRTFPQNIRSAVFAQPPTDTNLEYPKYPQDNGRAPDYGPPFTNGQQYGQRPFDQQTNFKNTDYQQREQYGHDSWKGPSREGLHQIETPYVQRGVKGKSIPRGPFATAVPHTVSTWKGPPISEDYGGYTSPKNYQQNDALLNSGIKRGKRNRDVEVACPVQSTYVPPRAALSDQSEWKYIVNVPERDQRFSQVVRVDVCLTEGQPCSSRLSLPFGFESRCRQKYIKKKLLSLNPDGQGTGEDNFFIPSCCVCEITRIGRK